MTRQDKFLELKSHAWYKKIFAKICDADIQFCLAFIAENEGLDCDAFEMKVNRMFLDKPKSKNWLYVSEILATVSKF